ncbi:MAG: hypothetical protein SNF33_01655 [Candidatus Algichlamydia australiensis]|nr:hypothetical protein [Chlamydiales bacterium]
MSSKKNLHTLSFEDKLLVKEARKRLKELDSSDNISFENAMKLAGWKEAGNSIFSQKIYKLENSKTSIK